MLSNTDKTKIMRQNERGDEDLGQNLKGLCMRKSNILNTGNWCYYKLTLITIYDYGKLDRYLFN